MNSENIDRELKRQVEDTMNYLSFSVKQDVDINGSVLIIYQYPT